MVNPIFAAGTATHSSVAIFVMERPEDSEALRPRAVAGSGSEPARAVSRLAAIRQPPTGGGASTRR
jgi:hypothetical protein